MAPGHELTEQQIERLAALARLELDRAERAELREQLERIIVAVRTLESLPLEGVEPLRHAAEIAARERDDEPQACLPREQALAGAPAHDGVGFLVPRVIEAGS